MSLTLNPAPSDSNSKPTTNNGLSTSFRDRSIHLPNFSQLKTKELRSGHRQSVRGLGWSIDGRKLATCGADRSIRIWVPERSIDHRASTELRAHSESVDQLVWHPLSPDLLASASADKTVRIWDTRSKTPSSQTITTPGSNINIAYHPSGDYIAVGDKTDTVSIIDTRTHRIVHTVCTRRSVPFAPVETYTAETMLGTNDEINELTFSPDGSLLLLSSGSGSVHIHSTTTYARLHSHPTHTANVFCLEYDPLSRFVATASSDAMIALWDSREWMAVKMFTSLSFPARAMGFSFDGELLAAGGEDREMVVLRTDKGGGGGDDEVVAKVPLAMGTMINTLAWHPSKYVLAYAGDELAKDVGVVRVFNL